MLRYFIDDNKFAAHSQLPFETKKLPLPLYDYVNQFKQQYLLGIDSDNWVVLSGGCEEFRPYPITEVILVVKNKQLRFFA